MANYELFLCEKIERLEQITNEFKSIFEEIKNSNYRELFPKETSEMIDLPFEETENKYFGNIIFKIQSKLAEFGIKGKIVNVSKGPVVDTFEWELGPNENVPMLISKAEDLSHTLSELPIRIVYPMTGRSSVGIEVPRNFRENIFLSEIINSEQFTNTTHQLPLVMGKDTTGGPIIADLTTMSHLLIAGATGSGKSTFIKSILASLLSQKSPDQMKLILIDPKNLELSLYAQIPHLIMPIITEAKMAANALAWACMEMERRCSLLSDFGVRNIEGFNHKLKNAPKENVDKNREHYQDSSEEIHEIPYIVIIVDEFADLILTPKAKAKAKAKAKEIETHICRLAAKGRAAGIHLILATQRPSVDVITGLIKSNFPTRVSFKVGNSIDSRTIINTAGAEKLLGKGDMLYKDRSDITRIHSAHVEEGEIEALTNNLSKKGPLFDPNIMEFLDRGMKDKEEVCLRNQDDDIYDLALKVVVEHQSASAPLLQRKLGIGYNRAVSLIEKMEKRGIVGPANGSRPRRILILNNCYE